MIKRFKKIRWKEGFSETVAFVFILPVIVMMIMAVLSTYVIGAANQQLIYTAYCVGRSTVVCETQELARNRANAVMQGTYGAAFDQSGSSWLIYDEGDTSARPVDPGHEAGGGGASGSLTHGRATYRIELIGGTTWEKGALLRCTVSQFVASPMPFTSKTYSKSIVMMVENGDGESEEEEP